MHRSVRSLPLMVIGLFLLLLTSSGHAYDLGNILSINGFLSQGYINSTGNNIFGDSEDDGSFELNEFALTLNSIPTENIRLSLQLLSRDLGDEGNNDLLVDWVMAEYQLNDYFGIRAGKVKLPIGLYNQQRDSDFLRPMAFLPQSIYNENKRALLVGAWGGSLYGNFSLDSIGDFDYQAYYGKVDFRNDSGQARGMERLVQSIAQQQGLGTVANFDAENQYVLGGSLIYSPPIDGLRLGFSYFTGESDFTFTTNGIPGAAQGNNKDLYVFSAELSNNNWFIASEYTEFTADRKVLGRDIPDGRSQGAYLLFCYHPYETVALSALYDLFYADKDDHEGSNYTLNGQPDYLGWRKDLGAAIRWDITDQWMVRAEYHNIDGAALQLPIFNPTGVERYWSYYVLKTSFNF